MFCELNQLNLLPCCILCRLLKSWVILKHFWWASSWFGFIVFDRPQWKITSARFASLSSHSAGICLQWRKAAVTAATEHHHHQSPQTHWTHRAPLSSILLVKSQSNTSFRSESIVVFNTLIDLNARQALRRDYFHVAWLLPQETNIGPAGYEKGVQSSNQSINRHVDL